jgi:hypothetical protein
LWHGAIATDPADISTLFGPAAYSDAPASTTGCEESNPKLLGAINIRAITIAIEARNVAVLAISLTIISFSIL